MVLGVMRKIYTYMSTREKLPMKVQIMQALDKMVV